jgi:hypothetical protein
MLTIPYHSKDREHILSQTRAKRVRARVINYGMCKEFFDADAHTKYVYTVHYKNGSVVTAIGISNISKTLNINIYSIDKYIESGEVTRSMRNAMRYQSIEDITRDTIRTGVM